MCALSPLYIAPSAPPQGFTGSNQSSTAIFLSWMLPPAIDINGVIQYYTVELDEVWTGRTLTFHPISPNISIRALHPYYIYQCRVAAYTVALGPFTSNLQIITGEDGKQIYISFKQTKFLLYSCTCFLLQSPQLLQPTSQ